MAKATDLLGDAEGHAALAICESLLLALSDLKIIGEKDAGDILTDAAAAYRGVSSSPQNAGRHLAVAAIIDRIIAGRNGVRP